MELHDAGVQWVVFEQQQQFVKFIDNAKQHEQHEQHDTWSAILTAVESGGVMSFADECRVLNSNCDALLGALLASDRNLPALIVEQDGCRGVAHLPSFNSGMGPQSGKIFIVWWTR